jgi:hypothetical protein
MFVEIISIYYSFLFYTLKTSCNILLLFLIKKDESILKTNQNIVIVRPDRIFYE